MKSRRNKSTLKKTLQPRPRALLTRLQPIWSDLVVALNSRWAKFSDQNLVKPNLTKANLLGSGYFGLVFSTSNKKLVFKITTDPDEGAFSQLILSDPFMRYNQGLPFIFDVFKLTELDSYIILRENVSFGNVDMPSSSPFIRTIDALDTYGFEYKKIESQTVKLLNAMYASGGRLLPQEYELALREAQGLIRMEILKCLKRLPNTSPNSKYAPSIQLIKYALSTYGVALWDLHAMNLGKHIYDMREFDSKIPPLDKDIILILDIGGNWGSPILDFSIDTLDI